MIYEELIQNGIQIIFAVFKEPEGKDKVAKGTPDGWSSQEVRKSRGEKNANINTSKIRSSQKNGELVESERKKNKKLD